MMKKLILTTSILLSALFSFSQNITWSSDIACIIYTHCGSCHNGENSVSGLPLLSYQEAFDNRLAIELFTNIGTMPPSLPNKDYSHIAGSKKLTPNEVALIREWALNEALRGDSTKEPAPPIAQYPVSKLSNPDISVKIPDFIVPDSAGHYRKCFVLTGPYSSSKLIKSIEVIPGNMAAVHGVFLYSDTSNIPVELDVQDPGDGYTHYFGIGSNTSKPFYGWVPGSTAFTYPENLSLKLDSGARIIVQLEYSEESGGMLDSTRINLKFDSNASGRAVEVIQLLSHERNLINGPLLIPIDSILTFEEKLILPSGLSLLGISPNLHDFCTSLEVFAILPNSDTIGLLQVEKWNPVWSEGSYFFQKPIHLPMGSILLAKATFDNTDASKHEPDDTLFVVTAGFGEEEEEMIFNFTCLPYQMNDEAMIIDTNQHLAHYQNCKPTNILLTTPQSSQNMDGPIVFPNPVHDLLQIDFGSDANLEPFQLQVFNLLGEELFNNMVSESNFKFSVASFMNGIYILKIKQGDKIFLKKIIKN